MPWPIKTSGGVTESNTEEPVYIVSKKDFAVVWAGAKINYSGICGSNAAGASGYWFESGDVDIQPVNASGWGLIRVPELATVHKLFVFPKDPNIQAAVDWAGGNISGTVMSGWGGISGNVALVHYASIPLVTVSGGLTWSSGLQFSSGVVDLIAFGSLC